jgi:energy-coupling factor transporter ATP-binding protein EcfA2
MITQLRFGPRAQEFTCRVSVDFEPGVNLVVGPNGSGKSTVVNALHYIAERVRKKERGEKVKNVSFKCGTTTRFFDSETMNPHVMSGDAAMSNATSMRFWLSGRSKSHGQCLAPVLTKSLWEEILHCRERLDHELITILLDEPESGLDQATLHEFARMVRRWSRKVQFIIATHSIWLWCELGGHFVVLGKDKDYVENTLKAWEAVWRTRRIS